jgi:hypothetical protein
MNQTPAMPLTRDFNKLVQKRIARDPAFRNTLLREGINTMLTGDVDTGKAILRHCIRLNDASGLT